MSFILNQIMWNSKQMIYIICLSKKIKKEKENNNKMKLK